MRLMKSTDSDPSASYVKALCKCHKSFKNMNYNINTHRELRAQFENILN